MIDTSVLIKKIRRIFRKFRISEKDQKMRKVFLIKKKKNSLINSRYDRNKFES